MQIYRYMMSLYKICKDKKQRFPVFAIRNLEIFSKILVYEPSIKRGA